MRTGCIAELGHALRSLGHTVKVTPLDSGLAFLGRGRDGWSGAADPRRDGNAAFAHCCPAAVAWPSPTSPRIKPSDTAGGTILFEVEDLDRLMTDLKDKGVIFKSDVIHSPVEKQVKRAQECRQLQDKLVGDQLLTPERGEEIANTMEGAGCTARLPSTDAGVPPRFPAQR